MSESSDSSVALTPTIDADIPAPDIGTERISTERFSSVEIMHQEWQKLWRCVWNMGPRVEQFNQPGDYVIHSLGRESFLFVMGDDEIIRCFFNVCQHRGNRLVEGKPCGNARFFKCPYHAWSWNIDGGIKGVPDRNTFPLIRAHGLPEKDLDLNEVTTDQWGGFVWFNIDGNAEPLLDYLDVLPEHIAPYELQNMRAYVNKTFLWDANWKIAADAFNESYHFRGIHPEMLSWANGEAKLQLHGKHSRMINEYGAPSNPYRNGSDISAGMKEWMNWYGMDAEAYEGPAKECRIAKQKHARAIQAQGGAPHYPYENMTDEQLSDIYHYFYFPNVAMNTFPEGTNAFRYRPHETDPKKCYFDLIMMAHFPDGEAPQCEHEYFDHNIDYLKTLDPAAAIASKILQQDADNVPSTQAGVQSEGFRGLYLGDQEIRLRHFYNTIDEYLGEQ